MTIHGRDGGSITGSVDDGWRTAIEDVGPAGVDKGKGYYGRTVVRTIAIFHVRK